MIDIRLRLDGRTCTQRCVWMSSIASRGGLPPPLKVKPARQRGGVVLGGLLEPLRLRVCPQLGQRVCGSLSLLVAAVFHPPLPSHRQIPPKHNQKRARPTPAHLSFPPFAHLHTTHSCTHRHPSPPPPSLLPPPPPPRTRCPPPCALLGPVCQPFASASTPASS